MTTTDTTTRRHDSASTGDAARFQTLEHLTDALAARPARLRDVGVLTRIIRRVEDGVREELQRSRLTREEGVPGDKWGRTDDRSPAAQLTVMEADIAALIANGQSDELFGDQLFVTIDLSVGSLPVGSRVRIGTAVLEVTPLPHNGCQKFLARFGAAALKFVSMKELRHRNLRGIYMTVIEDGEAAAGDAVTVISRPA